MRKHLKQVWFNRPQETTGLSTTGKLCILKNEVRLSSNTMRRFKLHLGSHNTTPIFGDLSPLKDIATLFSDFYSYLYNCSKTYIQQTHHLSRSAWLGLERDIQFVLAHPNGWGGEQQALMRTSAMVRAGIIPNDDSGRARISFVTEGEASLHFCLGKGLSEFARVCFGSINSVIPFLSGIYSSRRG